MSFSGLPIDEAWGAPASDPIKDAIRKEQLIKEITASQSDLKTLLARVQTVQKEVEKLASGNETLQMYIDNLTKQMAKQR